MGGFVSIENFAGIGEQGCCLQCSRENFTVSVNNISATHAQFRGVRRMCGAGLQGVLK